MQQQQQQQEEALHRHSRPLLTWRGLQAWSMGRRASGLCRLFIRIRRRPKLRLPCSLIANCNSNNQREAPSAAGFFVKWLAKMQQQQQKRSPACCLPMPVSCIKGEDHPTHHDHNHDVEVDLDGNPAKPYKRVDKLHPKQPLEGLNHEFSNKLGSPESSTISCLSSGGEGSFNSLSISSSSSSSSSSGSFHRMSGSKLKDTCAKVVHGGPSICELVAGNQLLMHLSAAPVVATPNHNANGGISTSSTGKDKKAELNPSHGLVANSSLRHRDSDISDRIVFFK